VARRSWPTIFIVRRLIPEIVVGARKEFVVALDWTDGLRGLVGQLCAFSSKRRQLQKGSLTLTLINEGSPHSP
jgi:hypothetical protein